MGILEYGAKFCAKKLDEMDRTQRYPIAVPSPEIVLHTDLPYCSGGDPAHRLDLCYPAKGGDFPLVIDIHGGGLIYGTKALNRDFTLHLAEQGFAVASLDYRLVPQTRFDGQIRDLFAGFRWLSEHLDDHPIQKDAVFLTGDSAGALLAVYAALIEQSSRLQRQFQVEPSGLPLLGLGLSFGMYFTRHRDFAGKLQPLFFGKDYRSRDFYPSMEPERLPELEILPPCYLVTSDDCALKPHSTAFEQLLRQHGVQHTFRCWPKNAEKELPHIFNVAHPDWPESRETMQERANFFRVLCSQSILV